MANVDYDNDGQLTYEACVVKFSGHWIIVNQNVATFGVNNTQYCPGLQMIQYPFPLL